MTITNVPTGDLKPYDNNSRIHIPEQIAQLASSINEFGFTNPLLIDEDNGVIAGHGRLMAALSLDQAEVPCIKLENLSEAQKKAYIIADNKIADNGGWDEDMLKMELIELKEDDYDLSFTGFDDKGLDAILSEGEAIIDEKEEVIEGEENKPVSSDLTEQYESSTIRQIILIYGAEEYSKVVSAMGAYAEKNGLSSNTEVVNHLLESQGYDLQDS